MVGQMHSRDLMARSDWRLVHRIIANEGATLVPSFCRCTYSDFKIYFTSVRIYALRLSVGTCQFLTSKLVGDSSSFTHCSP